MCNCNKEIKVLKIEALRHNKFIPEYKTEGASGMDLHAAITEPLTLEPFDRALVPTGIKIELPRGYEAQLRPRSGTAIKHGLTLINCVGTIDEDYRGEIFIPLVNLSNIAATIQPQDRVAQMVIAPFERVSTVVVEQLSETVRGQGGFNSTGVN